MTLEKGFYAISDQELFLFGTSGFWDREERMETYRAVKARKLPDTTSWWKSFDAGYLAGVLAGLISGIILTVVVLKI